MSFNTGTSVRLRRRVLIRWEKEKSESEGCPAPQTTENDSEKDGKDKPSCSSSKCSCRRKCGCSKPEVELSVSGIRPSMTRVATAGSAPTTDIGVAFAGSVDSYALDGSAHGQMQWVLGGGQFPGGINHMDELCADGTDGQTGRSEV